MTASALASSATRGVGSARFVVALIVLRLALAVPYAVFGPGLFMDDWWVLRNIRFDGILAGAGERQALARPGAWFLFNAEFGLIGRHPLGLYFVVTAAAVAVTVALFFALRRLVGDDIAAAVAAVHAILPNHASLDHWASAINIVVALALALAGVAAVARAYDENRRLWPAFLLFAAGGVCYEAVFVLMPMAAIGAPVVLGRPIRWRPTIAACAYLAGTAALMLANTQKELPSGRRFADFSLLWPGHFGRGIAVNDTIGRPLLVVASCVIVVVAARLLLPSMRRDTGIGERVVLCGLLVLGLGAVPFAKFPITVLGVNDRANVVSALGSAMVWVGVALVLRRWPLLLGVAALAWLLVVVPARWEKDRDWALVADRSREIVEVVARRFPDPAGPIVIGPAPFSRHGVVSLVADWDTAAALGLELDDPSVVARTARNERDFCRSSESLAWDAEVGAPSRARCR